jgi:hypothetical protein
VAFLAKRELRIVLFIVLPLAAAACVITIIAYRPKAPILETNPPPESFLQNDRLFPSDFIVPDSYNSMASDVPILSRNPHPKWAEEEVMEYWIDPRQIGIEYLERKNDALMEELLSTPR